MKALWRGSWAWADVGAGLLLVLLGILILVATPRIQESYSTDPLGPRFLPRLLSIVLIGLSLVLTARGLLRLRFHRAAPEGGEGGLAGGVGPQEPAAMVSEADLRVLQGVLAMGLYVLLLPAVGYAVGSTAFFIALLLVAGERRRGMVLVQSATVMLVLYLLFGVVLDVDLPGGFLPPWFRGWL